MLTLFGRLAGHEVTRFHLRDQLEDIDPATDTTLMVPVLRKKKKTHLTPAAPPNLKATSHKRNLASHAVWDTRYRYLLFSFTPFVEGISGRALVLPHLGQMPGC